LVYTDDALTFSLVIEGLAFLDTTLNNLMSFSFAKLYFESPLNPEAGASACATLVTDPRFSSIPCALADLRCRWDLLLVVLPLYFDDAGEATNFNASCCRPGTVFRDIFLGTVALSLS